MILYIHFGYLHKFNEQYRRSEYLQSVAVNLTGIKWEIIDSERDGIESCLSRYGIKYEIE